MGSGIASKELWCVCNTHAYEATVRFYRDVLELEVRTSWENPDSTGTIFEVGTAVLEILSAAPGRSCQPPSGGWLRIEVDDVGAVLSRVRDEGHPIRMPLKALPWGERAFKAVDPNGWTVSVFEKTGT